MIPPFLVFHQGGADVIRDEALLHQSIRARFVERRRHRPLWHTCNGIILGASGAYVASLGAQGAVVNEWTQPSTVIAIIGMIFAAGQVWNARQEDRRRISKIEDSYVTRSEFQTLTQSVHEVSMKLDRLIERP